MIMGNVELSRRYRAAKNKRQQVKILSELNDCSVDEIIEKLIEAGISKKELPRASRRKNEMNDKSQETNSKSQETNIKSQETEIKEKEEIIKKQTERIAELEQENAQLSSWLEIADAECKAWKEKAEAHNTYEAEEYDYDYLIGRVSTLEEIVVDMLIKEKHNGRKKKSVD